MESSGRAEGSEDDLLAPENEITYIADGDGNIAPRLFVAGTELDRSVSPVVRGAEKVRTITFPNTVRAVSDFAFDSNRRLRHAILNEILNT